MADQSNIFGNEPTPEPTPAPESSPTQEVKPSEATVTPDPYADLLKTITNDSGVQKYGTVSDALNALPHAQSHIKTIEQENAQMKEQMASLQEQVEKMNKIEDTIAQLTANKESEQPSETLSQQQVMELVQAQLNQTKQQENALHNQKTVAQTLSEQFGDKAEEVYNAKAQELGIDVNFLNDLAAKSPVAVLSYFKGAEVQVPSKSLEGSVNTDAFNTPPPTPKGRNPMLVGSSTADVLAAWENAGKS